MPTEKDIQLERVADIILNRLPKSYQEAFSASLSGETLLEAIGKEISERQIKHVKAALHHLGDQDLILAEELVNKAKRAVEPKTPPVRPTYGKRT